MTAEFEKLNPDTIVDALFEVRFESVEPFASNIIAGSIYPKVKKKFPKHESLGVANIPRDIRNIDPQFKFVADQRFSGNDYSISIGNNVFCVSAKKPYRHWEHFKPVILEQLEALKQSEMVKKVVRIGLRYTNLIPTKGSPAEQFGLVDFSAVMGGFDLTKSPTILRTELSFGGFVNLVQLACNADVRLNDSGENFAGLLLDIDTSKSDGLEVFWDDASKLLEDAHAVEKQIFKRALNQSTVGYLSTLGR